MFRVSTSECPPGSRIKDDSCVDCEPGLYQDESGQTSCKECAVGQYRYDAISCKNCIVGTYRDTIGAADITQCHPCLTDKYQDQEGQTSCKDCDVARYQNEFGQTGCKGNVKESEKETGSLYVYCPKICPGIPCESTERCVDGTCVQHDCDLNQPLSTTCRCFGVLCDKWCMDNGECVDILDSPDNAELNTAFSEESDITQNEQ